MSGLIEQASLRHYSTIDSTNTEARRLFAAGEGGPLFLLADEQTAGKGRLDRNWASLRGNCYSTLLLPLDVPLPAVAQLGFVVALAVADVVRVHVSTAEVKLKWPNDCLVGGAKIAGILCEVLSPSPPVVAIGCGINVAHAPVGLAYPATCLAALGASATRDQVFQSYRKALEYWLGMWNRGTAFTTIRTAWMQQAFGIGETVSMAAGAVTQSGIFEGITDEGAVLLKPPHGAPLVFHAGDLHIPSLAKLRAHTT